MWRQKLFFSQWLYIFPYLICTSLNQFWAYVVQFATCTENTVQVTTCNLAPYKLQHVYYFCTCCNLYTTYTLLAFLFHFFISFLSAPSMMHLIKIYLNLNEVKRRGTESLSSEKRKWRCRFVRSEKKTTNK